MEVDAVLKGLKLSTAARILFATAGRVRISTARQFSVASMRMGSLLMSVIIPAMRPYHLHCRILEDAEQSVEETSAFGLKIREREERVLPWYDRKGGLILVRSLQVC